MLAHVYPLSTKHLVVDSDTSNAGLWHMSEEETKASARVFDRKNSNGDTTPYYRYMDTATSALAPFKPELIEQLVHVKDNEPLNPLVVMNKGHLLSQLTFFIGPVNFYCTVRGKRQCKVLNTGDSCLITPYVPHSFTTRDPAAYAAIVPVTFSGSVRDALSDLVHLDIRDVMRGAGDLRNPGTVFRNRLERFAELRGLSLDDDVAPALVAKGHASDAVAQTLNPADAAGASHDASIIASLAEMFDIDIGELDVRELKAVEEVIYKFQPDQHTKRTKSQKCAFASSPHFPDVGGFQCFLCGEEESY